MARDPLDPNGPAPDLDRTGAALYRKVREYLKGQNTWEESDTYLLSQACRYDQRARVAREAIPTDSGSPVLTTRGRSEHSGDVAHPAVRIAEAAEKSFVDALKELGLTPAARKRLEIEAGRKPGGKFGF